VRHGATVANLARLRCGGDLDLPLTDQGRAQAAEAAERLAQLEPRVGCIITSDLQRTRETAEIIARALPGSRVRVEAGFAERHLGAWNLRPIDETQAWLDARQTPPGGESNDEFLDRIDQAMRRIEQEFACAPVLVSSRGVARVLRELLNLPKGPGIANGDIAEFDLAGSCYTTERSAL
jgi:2,3-bisphosphoglycerate-dependent phosphoglycerate mutase